ncbi:MAG: polyprenyl synthetase family protein [Actinomycetota bacterium]
MTDLSGLIPLTHIWEQLTRVEERLLEAATSEDPYLTKIAQHLLLAGGKRFRALLALLAAEFGPRSPSLDGRPVEAAVAVELIHVGSLYHDDVIDESDVRRGAPSVNANWTNTVAILAGDFLLARASEVAATYLSRESVRLLAATYAELVEGQTRELQLIDSLDHPQVEYERVIAGKTAALIRTSARLGAIAADATDEAVDALSAWAWELGMVFQLSDDALDLVGTEDTLGKPAGSDIREGTFTLPVLSAAQGPEGDRLRHLLGRPRPYPEGVVEEAISLIRGGGWVDRAIDLALNRLEHAQSHIADLPPSPAKDILSEMGAFLVERVETERNRV